MNHPRVNASAIEAISIPEVPVLTHPDLFDADGTLQPMPAAFWAQHDRINRATFGHHKALYAFPTTEGIDYIRKVIAGRSAIEIGAGNGAFCKALGIPGTDNFQQVLEPYKSYYETMRQPIVNYGSHVERMEAALAVAKYQPKVVLACWVTHLYMPRRHELGGNEIGVDEHFLLSQVDDYIFIGDTYIHSKKPLFRDIFDQKITTHYIENMILDNNMFPSRASRGDSFLIHLKRK